MLLVLPAAAPGDVIPRRKRDVATDACPRLANETADVTSLHVQEHSRQEQSVLRRDHGRPTRVFDVGELAEGNLRAPRRGDEDPPENLRIGAIFGRVPNANREAPAA